jgi:hypothetical protein
VAEAEPPDLERRIAFLRDQVEAVARPGVEIKPEALAYIAREGPANYAELFGVLGTAACWAWCARLAAGQARDDDDQPASTPLTLEICRQALDNNRRGDEWFQEAFGVSGAEARRRDFCHSWSIEVSEIEMAVGELLSFGDAEWISETLEIPLAEVPRHISALGRALERRSEWPRRSFWFMELLQ